MGSREMGRTNIIDVHGVKKKKKLLNPAHMIVVFTRRSPGHLQCQCFPGAEIVEQGAILASCSKCSRWCEWPYVVRRLTTDRRVMSGVSELRTCVHIFQMVCRLWKQVTPLAKVEIMQCFTSAGRGDSCWPMHAIETATSLVLLQLRFEATCHTPLLPCVPL